MLSKKIGRRQFLHISAVGAAGVIVSACAAPAATTEAPAKALPTLAPEKPEPTTPPAATEAPQATEAPPATEAPVTKFKESPTHAQMVTDGKLPPVDERLPLEPRVLPNVDGIGVYSDTLNLLSLGTFGDFGHEMFQGSFGENNADGSIFPDFCSGYEVSDDAKTYTIHIRKGLKWSDGEPVTTEDVRFWHEDDATYKEINTTTPGFGYTMGTDFCALEIVDDFTYSFRGPSRTRLSLYASLLGAMWWCSPTARLLTT
jgi:peptide/nickel transport system substrate-binding protein